MKMKINRKKLLITAVLLLTSILTACGKKAEPIETDNKSIIGQTIKSEYGEYTIKEIKFDDDWEAFGKDCIIVFDYKNTAEEITSSPASAFQLDFQGIQIVNDEKIDLEIDLDEFPTLYYFGRYHDLNKASIENSLEPGQSTEAVYVYLLSTEDEPIYIIDRHTGDTVMTLLYEREED